MPGRAHTTAARCAGLALATFVACRGGPAKPLLVGPPSFEALPIADQFYEVGQAVELHLPAVRGGNEPLTYTLKPNFPGLTFDADAWTWTSDLPRRRGLPTPEIESLKPQRGKPRPRLPDGFRQPVSDMGHLVQAAVTDPDHAEVLSLSVAVGEPDATGTWLHLRAAPLDLTTPASAPSCAVMPAAAPRAERLSAAIARAGREGAPMD